MPAMLAEGPLGRADLIRRSGITLQAGSHTAGSGTGFGPALAITAGQAAYNTLCRPPAGLRRLSQATKVRLTDLDYRPATVEVTARTSRWGRFSSGPASAGFNSGTVL